MTSEIREIGVSALKKWNMSQQC